MGSIGILGLPLKGSIGDPRLPLKGSIGILGFL